MTRTGVQGAEPPVGVQGGKAPWQDRPVRSASAASRNRTEPYPARKDRMQNLSKRAKASYKRYKNEVKNKLEMTSI